MEQLEEQIYRHYLRQLPPLSKELREPHEFALSDLLPRYGSFFFDAWGTLYVEEEPYPGALELLEKLRRANRPIRLLTNNGSVPPAKLLHSINRFGFGFELHEIVSSGSLLANLVQKLELTELYAIGRNNASSILETVGLRFSTAPHRPVVLLSSRPTDLELEEQLPIAEQILRKENALLIVLNPDAMAPFTDGTRRDVAGAVAHKLLLQTGCRVHYLGKPFPEIFSRAIATLPQLPLPPVMIGDTIGTDIVGAELAGIDSVLMLTGNSSPESWHRDGELLGAFPTALARSL